MAFCLDTHCFVYSKVPLENLLVSLKSYWGEPRKKDTNTQICVCVLVSMFMHKCFCPSLGIFLLRDKLVTRRNRNHNRKLNLNYNFNEFCFTMATPKSNHICRKIEVFNAIVLFVFFFLFFWR